MVERDLRARCRRISSFAVQKERLRRFWL